MRYKIRNQKGMVIGEFEFIWFALVEFYKLHKKGITAYFEIDSVEGRNRDEKV